MAVSRRGEAENLTAYWTRGAGAAKIAWGVPGDFRRCVKHLQKYVRDPEGLCAEYHKMATRLWPGHHGGKNPMGPG